MKELGLVIYQSPEGTKLERKAGEEKVKASHASGGEDEGDTEEEGEGESDA